MASSAFKEKLFKKVLILECTLQAYQKGDVFYNVNLSIEDQLTLTICESFQFEFWIGMKNSVLNAFCQTLSSAVWMLRDPCFLWHELCSAAAAVFRLDVPLIVLRLAKKYVMMMPAKHFSMSPGYRDWNQIFIAHLRSEKLLSFSTTQSHYHVTCLPKRADMNWKKCS